MKFRYLVFALAESGITLPALAETWVEGAGDNIQAASDNAVQNAEKGAASRGTCISHLPVMDKCEKKVISGTDVWVCRAAFSNHKGSCVKKSDWDKFRDAKKALGF
ncbi:hypothetical protein [Variovorax paradoxus]|uniref:hypothetical protein n=1 Tax=Variovorax paradoxus TaxID=34073 RepID=UPI003D6531EB